MLLGWTIIRSPCVSYYTTLVLPLFGLVFGYTTLFSWQGPCLVFFRRRPLGVNGNFRFQVPADGKCGTNSKPDLEICLEN
ncbi:hypothetical protein DM02DRAFT_410167 [Periconia macrospinosa]|uniref:Uncharacterized protein n=1 Tax=Periconia macrospinosa TaxID=97972 RepID=A0A2V1DQ41_9PLEO|nr:hypothetical protein DM02DRAFT_410167 [Periconia macrospinosa]